MAQKCLAILKRHRNKGRDFYDLVYLMGKGIGPNMDYIFLKTGIQDTNKLKLQLLDKCRTSNIDDMAQDLAPFLFSVHDQKKVKLFIEYLKTKMDN